MHSALTNLKYKPNKSYYELLLLEYNSKLLIISEVLIDASKANITPDKALEEIRAILKENRKMIYNDKLEEPS